MNPFKTTRTLFHDPIEDQQYLNRSLGGLKETPQEPQGTLPGPAPSSLCPPAVLPDWATDFTPNLATLAAARCTQGLHIGRGKSGPIWQHWPPARGSPERRGERLAVGATVCAERGQRPPEAVVRVDRGARSSSGRPRR
ncbi:unnamed protein product [Boreogadus saida]